LGVIAKVHEDGGMLIFILIVSFAGKANVGSITLILSTKSDPKAAVNSEKKSQILKLYWTYFILN